MDSPTGGTGLLLGGVLGTPAAKVTIIVGGVSGTDAAKIALGMRAMVTVIDTDPARLDYHSDIFGGRLVLVVLNPNFRRRRRKFGLTATAPQDTSPIPTW